MKKMILTLMVLSPLLAKAGVCSQEEVIFLGGTNFYKSFITTKRNLKQNYVRPYKNVDTIIEDFLLDVCDSRASEEEIEEGYLSVCKESCAVEAKSFHNLIKTNFFKGAKVNRLTKECQSICDDSLALKLDFLPNK